MAQPCRFGLNNFPKDRFPGLKSRIADWHGASLS